MHLLVKKLVSKNKKRNKSFLPKPVKRENLSIFSFFCAINFYSIDFIATFVQILRKCEVIDTNFLQQLEAQVDVLLTERVQKSATIKQLTTEIEVMKRQLAEIHVKLAELQKKYDNLLIAHTIIKAEKGDIQRAKAKLSSMLETIDRCIGKLNA